MRDVYLHQKHMILSCLDLVTIAIDGSTASPRNQKMSSAYWNWFDNVDGIQAEQATAPNHFLKVVHY
jgi:hypothetical protein